MVEVNKLTEICTHCQAELAGRFCSQCGHPTQLPRIDKYYIFTEIGSVLNFQKGILFTIKELLLRPGANIRSFITKDRNRIVKPVFFIIVCSLVYAVVQKITKFEDGYMKLDPTGMEESTVIVLFQWLNNNYGYANILLAFFIAIWVALFFRRYQYNFFEIIILLCFVMGMGMLLLAFFGMLEVATKLPVLQFGAILSFVYISWAIGQFFDRKKKVNYLKAFLSYFLGMVSFLFVLLISGIAIDWIWK